MKKPEPRVGDTWERNGERGVVRSVLKDTPGGVVFEEPVEGLLYWNTDELSFVSRAKKS